MGFQWYRSDRSNLAFKVRLTAKARSKCFKFALDLARIFFESWSVRNSSSAVKDYLCTFECVSLVVNSTCDASLMIILLRYMHTKKPRTNIRGLQRDIVCLWPIAPSYTSLNAGGIGGVAGSKPMSTAVQCAHHVTWSPNKLWRSTSIINILKEAPQFFHCRLIWLLALPPPPTA